MAKVLFLLSLCAVAYPGPRRAPPEVFAAAQKGLLPLAGDMSPDLGFVPGDTPQMLRLDEPFQFRTITPAAVIAYKPGQTLGSLLSDTQAWEFPVMVRGEPRALLTVDKAGGGWEAVGIGKAQLARQIESVNKRWSTSTRGALIFVVVYQASQHFFSVPGKKLENLTPFTFTVGGGKNCSTLAPLADTIARIRPGVMRSVGQAAP